MSLGHLSFSMPAGSPARSSAASIMARATTADRRHRRSGVRYLGRKPSESRSAAPLGATQALPDRPRPAVCSSATATHTSAVLSASQVRTCLFYPSDAAYEED